MHYFIIFYNFIVIFIKSLKKIFILIIYNNKIKNLKKNKNKCKTIKLHYIVILDPQHLGE
jgi:hypothetical protein